MVSTFYNQQLTAAGGSRNATRRLKSRVGDQLDELAVFALVAVALFYIAAASCWFIF